jgi:alkylated DNA repair dioxygenase AlkB
MANIRSQPRSLHELTWQPSLLDSSATRPGFDMSFAAARRTELGRGAWVEHCPQWVTGAASLFEIVVDVAPWTHRIVPMYGRMVEEPRLTAWYGDGPGAQPEILGEMAVGLGARYTRHFDGVGAALYRDGRDSVAWHGDRIDPVIADPIVAIVSLGSARTLRLRPRGGGPARAFTLLPGDLFVMGGTCQRTWEHSVPKVAAAGPRLSLQFRHSR